jgi:YHS domain-containing protein
MIRPWKQTLPAWLLSATSTVGLLAAPSTLDAQSKPIYQNGKIVHTAPAPKQPQAPPVAPAVSNAAPTGESAVQQELRRLYAESGREMPEVPKNVQAQVQQQALPPSPAPTQAAVPMPNTAVPRASAPVSKKPNAVASFFKKLVPGGQSKPRTMTPGVAQPQASAPIVATGPAAQQPRYAPFGSDPPRRLPTTNAVAAAPSTSASPAATLPPSPTPVLEVPQAQATIVVRAPVATLQPQTAPQPQTSPPPAVIAPPAAQAESPFRPATEEPRFEQPLVVEEVGSPATASEAVVQPSTAAAPEAVASIDDFIDPFTELSEKEADGNRKVATATAVAELMIEEKPAAEPNLVPHTAAVIEAAPVTESANPPLAIPSHDSVTEAAPAPGDAPLLPTPNVALPVISAEPPLLVAPPEPLQPSTQAPSTPVADASDSPITPDDRAAKMARIRERGGMKGLKGFCPVTLKEERELKDAQSQFQSSFRGQKFHFAASEAKTRFDAEPERYAPAAYGADVVVLIRDKDVAEGTLEFAAWFKGKLYLFASEDSHDTFVADPAKYAAVEGLE